VITYRVDDADTGRQIAHFHMDLFPREGKFSHAAAFPLVPGRRLEDGTYQMPVSAIVANFTKPSGDRPSLLTHQEVETFFHEFGHILHQTLTAVDLVRFSGTSTERDFVEAPSQIMEHWTWKPDVLARFARHHETGEPIPTGIVEQLAAAKQLNVSVAKLRQIQFALLDMRLHDASEPKDLDRILEEVTAVALLPMVEGTFFPASFGHLLGGYDAGYYGYLWSEVFGDDMFSRFEEEGYTDAGVGRDYRRSILERGGQLDGMDLLRDFLGREPNDAAFLRNLGIDV
jgi:Zn-dependent oligopeptidase